MQDLGRPDSASSSHGLCSNAAEQCFSPSITDIGEQLYGCAMTPKDCFNSVDDEQASIENIGYQRKGFLVANARLIIDLEAAFREDADQQGIDIEEMDRIDYEMDRQALLNMASQHLPHRVKLELEDEQFLVLAYTRRDPPNEGPEQLPRHSPLLVKVIRPQTLPQVG